MGGYKVEITWDTPYLMHKFLGTNPPPLRGLAYEGTHRVPSAFHLPEVCRQIYSETSTRGYTLNSFSFDNDSQSTDIDMMRKWADSLTPAQL